MKNNWVVNSSPIIILGKISRISFLYELNHPLIIPDGVAKEISLGVESDPALKWINTNGRKYIVDVGESDLDIQKWDLGLGETQVISHCVKKPSSIAIVDDLAARRCAQTYGVKCKGTLGVVLEAKKSGLVAEIKPILDQLICSGFRINKSLYDTIPRQANE